MAKILLVEDNPKYAGSAKQYLASRGYQIALAEDYAEALAKLKNPKFDGAIIDCFFPEQTGSEKREAGLAAVKEMLASDPRGRRETPTAKAITQVGNMLGTQVAKLFVKNARADYRQHVDLYWALEQAIKEDEAQQPLGILVAAKAEERGLPFVLATSTHHHDELTQPVQDYAGRKGWSLIDCAPGSQDQKATPEFWARVLSSLETRLK